MKIVFFAHPSFLGSQSMPRYATWLSEGMRVRGHQIEIWSPKATFFNLKVPSRLKKWMGYIDQYIIFPIEVKNKLKKLPKDTLFVFTDHALGPWVPLVANRPHVIHCHDFLAQRSALGEFKENPTGWTGKIYQWYIRRGYQKGKNFVSISKKTQADLHQFLKETPIVSEVVYNGLTRDFECVHNKNEVREKLYQEIGVNITEGFILHVGGNQWYKNRQGVIEIYEAWRDKSLRKLPLLMIGNAPNEKLKRHYELSRYKDDIHFVINASDELVKLAYQGADLFLFPSLEEGFGWPIAEAMASGCPVVTTQNAPMTEVGGDAAFYLDRRPSTKNHLTNWGDKCAVVIEEFFTLSNEEQIVIKKKGLEQVKRFDSFQTLSQIEEIYLKLVKFESTTHHL
ncbi:glycosyltransferase [Runella zeae]|uniref:glycosyltransferase n=1 Tax=Runella zeae TaxID=94255 RepID=UPI00041950D9|nr:glycosyltransferase [Runella zeae]